VKILTTIADVRRYVNPLIADNQRIGFVPTMGALHQGHLSLVANARQSATVVIVSIFVNPLQFNNSNDFDTYPQTFEKDLNLLENAGIDAIFFPSASELYPAIPALSFNFGVLEHSLEGTFRPGHFNGVGIVVAKLLNIVKPHVVFFGQKDLQQVCVVKALVKDLSFDVVIEVVETVREADGLAMSSRNLRLNHDERKASLILIQTLIFCKDELISGGDWLTIREQALAIIRKEPLATLEYLEFIDADSLENQERFDSAKQQAVVIACYIGEIRLIDNLLVNL
jgi:pantoate--beta-alanine ligase